MAREGGLQCGPPSLAFMSPLQDERYRLPRLLNTRKLICAYPEPG